MRPRSALLAGVLVLVGVAVALAPVAGAVVDGQGATAGAVSQADNETDDPSFGVRLSSFMQASTAEANGSVDSGMWAAEFNDSAAKDREVRNRVAKLERRLDRLEARMDRLEQRRAAGRLPEGVYLAQASRLTAEIASLETAINETDTAAATAGVNATRLDRLRTAAANASGQEVARIARNLTVVSPQGPPATRGPPGERVPPGLSGENDTDAGPPEDSGPPGLAGENGTDTGPAADRGPPGPAADNGTNTGPPDRGPPGASRNDTDQRADEGTDSDRESGPPGSDGPPGRDDETTAGETDDADADQTDESTGNSGDGADPRAGNSGGGPPGGNPGGGGPSGR